LKRFLFGRILRAIDERESKIAARLTEADAKEKEAGEQLALYRTKLRELEEAQEAMLAQVKLEVERQHAEMLERAKERVHSLEANWQEELDRERHTFLLELRQRAASEILAIARRVVADLASVDVQQCAVQVFLENIRSLDSDAREKLKNRELSIRSEFELSEPARCGIQQAVQEWLESPVNLEFEAAPGMGLGLELRGDGWRIGWNSESYLEALEEELKEALEQGSHAGRVEEKAAV
jgi:F-type H+-transporting ATPase subunit b